MGRRVLQGGDASVCATETASLRFVCPVICTFCSYSPEHVAVVYLNLSNITAGRFKGIGPKPVCLYMLFGHCTTFHAFKWLHVVFTLLLWALNIFIGFFFLFYIYILPFPRCQFLPLLKLTVAPGVRSSSSQRQPRIPLQICEYRVSKLEHTACQAHRYF